MCNVTMNQEKSGIEIRFDTKPQQSVLDGLREHGFKWSNRQKMWYAKQSDERMAFVATLSSCSCNNNSEKVQTSDEAYDLFALTRTDAIGSNCSEKLSTKEIAARIRLHIRRRFPMCRISVTTSYGSMYSAIHIEILESPFAKDSDELKAIAEYFQKYAQSFRYCTDFDPYGDYGSSYNFSGAYNPLSYGYKQTEMTVKYMNMAERFQQAKAQDEVLQQQREAQELERMRKEREEQEKQAAIAEQQRYEASLKVHHGAQVVHLDHPYFLEDVIETKGSKNDWLSEYEDEAKQYETVRTFCEIAHEVHLTRELYEIFSKQLLTDWDFIAGTGGSRTDDLRISSMQDYHMMDEQERKTVQFYSRGCVAVFCEDKLAFVVDAQGYSYCRYVFLVDEKTTRADAHAPNQVISEKEYRHYAMLADRLEDASTDIIIRNGWMGEGNRWNEERFDDYKQAMIMWIEHNQFPMSVHVVRAIPESAGDSFKAAMYGVLLEMSSLAHQMKRADIKRDQRITIVQLDSWIGGVHLNHCTFDHYEHCKYAQYEDNVKIVMRPKHKRDLHYKHYHGHVLIYDGWLPDVPEELMFDISTSPNGVVTKRSKFMSFDYAQYGVIMKHYESLGFSPIVNTVDTMKQEA